MGSRTTLTLVAVMLAVLAAGAASSTAAPTALRPPAHTWLETSDETTATLRWTAVAGAAAYDVRQDGALLGTVTETAVRITGIPPASSRLLQVVARDGGSTSAPGEPVPATTRAPSGCTHFVSTSGSDAATGGSTTPWRTLQRLVDAWRPGWVGCVEGSFVEDVTIRRGGTPAAKVVLRSRPGTTASIRGRIWIADGADDVVVANLRLDGRANVGATRGDLPSPTINGDRAMLIDNDISNARTRVCVVLGSIRGFGSTTGSVLAFNRIHDCGRRGRNTHHGIYVESAVQTRIVHNVIFDNADRGIQLYPNAQRSLIVGNLLDANGTGIIFSGAEGFASSNNRVLRNVIANSRLRSNVEHYWEQPRRPGTGNVVSNTCLGGARQGNVALPVAGYVIRSSTTGRLQYRDRAARDFRPLPGSGCRNELLRAGPLPLAPVAG